MLMDCIISLSQKSNIVIPTVSQNIFDVALDYSILDTIYLIGIENSSTFSKLFKNYFELSPKQYQKNINKGEGIGRRG